MAKVGNSTRSNKSLYYAQKQCAFVRENPEGDNVTGFSPPTDSSEESQSTTAQLQQKRTEKIMKFNSKETFCPC